MSLLTTRQEIKRDIALSYRIFAKLGWGDLGDGHISGRDPELTDCFWLLSGDTAFAHASEDSLMLVGPDGSIKSERGTPNWPAFYIHAPILNARPDITSVAHTHTPAGTPFAAEARQLEPITQEACIFVDDHSLFDDEEVQVQDTACGERIAKALGKSRAVILRNHGLLTVGKTVRESTSAFVLMERVAEAHLAVRNPKPISHNAALYAKGDLATDAQFDHAFHNLVQHHLTAAPSI